MTRSWKTLAAGLVLVLGLGALAGCSSSGGSLDGTQWKLTGWSMNSLDPAAFTITAKFAGGQISGTGGVNTYGGPYRIGPGGDFSAGPLASTQMAGPEPAMRAESGYLTLLGQARSYKMAAGKLTLFDGGGNESLIFAAAGK
jgi:heat shock protein HslJ